jgi:hypothetical protein
MEPTKRPMENFTGDCDVRQVPNPSAISESVVPIQFRVKSRCDFCQNLSFREQFCGMMIGGRFGEHNCVET